MVVLNITDSEETSVTLNIGSGDVVVNVNQVEGE